MYGLDLFSGIGGITEALKGYVEPIAYCERDRYSQAVLLSRMAKGELPIAPIWDDVTTLRSTYIPNVDIIYGGFPCQDFSIAGLGKGMEGQRSILFREIIRLVSEIRPRFVFLENVPKIIDRGGLLSITGEFTHRRYDCRWGVLSSGRMGANHLRRRWWLLANAREFRRSTVEEKCKAKRSTIYRPLLKEKRYRQHHLQIPLEIPISEASSGVCRVDDGVPSELHRIRVLGNAVDPRVAREAFERLMGLK
jgi:DNA (cytosine-5)-methyltransferase 1